ncbi:hypothetical protein [Nitratireductor sp. CH_MIT9313-5]|uniref:hypothetical protein n=1 Tax=Nitratireductor sp. CH_MIT9313-5 TaxID=3107764 RepID=UPI0030094A63
MKRPSYRHAIAWLAHNDDTQWLNDEDPIESVSTALVADLFGVDVERVTRDLRRFIKRTAKDARSAS